MLTLPSTLALPFYTDPDGAIRVGSSRVLLEIVIRAFRRGATPESIVDSYPTLALADVYAVIAYYLQHRTEVDEYVTYVQQAGQQLRQEIEARQPDIVLMRERLLARIGAK